MSKVLYDNTTGQLAALIHHGHIPNDLPVGLVAKDVGVVQSGSVWNREVQDFVIPPSPTKITVDDFIKRFKPHELENILTIMGNETVSTGVKMKVQTLVEYMKLSSYIDTSSSYIRDSVRYLETKSLIGEDRANDIVGK